MRFTVFAVLLVFCVNSSAVDAKTSIKTKNSKEEHISSRRLKSEGENEAKLKKSYLQSKKDYLYRTSQIASKASVVAHAQAVECANDQSGMVDRAKCHIKEISKRSSQSFHQSASSVAKAIQHSQSWFGYAWTGLKDSYRKISRTFVKFDNQLPQADGIFFERISQGASPLYLFSTNEEMTDSDGSIDHVVYDFGHGLPISIPANEINPYAEMEHVFPSTGTYDVSLKIYDDQNEFTEYTQTVDVVNDTIPLNNFSYVVTSGTTVDFSGVASSATSFTRFRWNMGDGTGNFNGTTLTSITHTFDNPGEYHVTFQAWDNKDARARITKTIYVGVPVPPEAPPYAILKMDKVFEQGPMTVHFDASLSVTQAGNSVSHYQWDFGDFDSIANYATGATASHTYKRPGTYFGIVRVFDSSNNVTEKPFRVFVGAGSIEAPTIQARQSWTYRDIAFDVSSWALSSTSDPSTFIWNFGDGNIENGLTSVEHQYAADGMYTVQLTAMDVQGVRHVVSKVITIANTFDMPIVQLNYSDIQTINQPGNYYGGGSSDPSGGELTYTWNFGDGTMLSGAQYDSPTHTYMHAGVYSIRLTVTNERGLSQSQYGSVTVQDGSYLKAEIIYTPKTGIAPVTVNFSSAMSVANPSPIVKRVWQFGDNTGSDQSTVSKYFGSPGVYWVKLYVQDALGNESVSYKEITAVNGGEIPRNNQPPRAVFSECFDGLSAQKVNFDASKSSDPEGGIKYYEWNVDGVEQPDGVKMAYYFQPGTHTVKLTVIDVWGAKQSVSKTFKIGTLQAPIFGYEYSPSGVITGATTFFAMNEEILIPLLPLDKYIYTWDFGDGSATTVGTNVQHAFPQPGTYWVSVSVPNYNGFQIVHKKQIVVANYFDPVVDLKIRDIQNTQEIQEGGTYKGLITDETLIFKMSWNNSKVPVVETDWNFGDGTTGFGSFAEHTYHKPGTYNVSLTGYSKDGRSDTTTATVVIPEAVCSAEDGPSVCLRLDNAQGNVLPLSASSWVVSHSLGSVNISNDPADTPANWIRLVEAEPDDTPTTIDISDIVTIVADKVEISKTGLVAKNINLDIGYKIEMDARSVTDVALNGESPKFFFGRGALSITASEDNVRLIISNGSIQLKKYFKLGTSTSVLISDLPSGVYTVEAKKDTRSEFYTATLSNSSTVNVAVDLDPVRLKQKQDERMRPRSMGHGKSAFEIFRDHQIEFNRKMNALPPKRSKDSRNFWPGWAYGICGQEPPFDPAHIRELNEGELKRHVFSSSDPSSQAFFQRIRNGVTRPVEVRCGVATGSVHASFERWKQLTTIQACIQPPYDFSEYYSFRAGIAATDKLPIHLKFTVRDSFTHESETTAISTTASQLMTTAGLNYGNVTERMGLWVDNLVDDYGYPLVTFVDVPEQYMRPEIKIEIQAPNLSGDYKHTHLTQCYLVGVEPGKDKITEIKAGAGVQTPAFDNAKFSLDSQFRNFPVQYDLDSRGPLALVNNTPYLADYELLVTRGEGSNEIDWDTLKVTMEYGSSQKKTWIYTPALVSSTTNFAILPAGKGKNSIRFLLDAAAPSAENEPLINWEPGVGEVKLKFEGFKGTESRTFEFSKKFNALFDAKQENNSPVPDSICSFGIYNLNSANISAYASDRLLRFLRSLSGSEGVRCNDMSMPFGAGVFRWPDAKPGKNSHNGHKNGLIADIRYFNELGSYQDNYDKEDAKARIVGVTSYLEFTKNADDTANATSADPENSTNSFVQRKLALKNYCNGPGPNDAKTPCDETTTFADISYEKVLKICQWYYSDPIVLASCPGLDGAKLVEYSRWVEYSYKGLKRMKDLGGVNRTVVSSGLFDQVSGKAIKVHGVSLGKFQFQALNTGEWPRRDSRLPEPVYLRNSSGALSSSPISSIAPCFLNNTCNLGLVHSNGHLHHMDVGIK